MEIMVQMALAVVAVVVVVKEQVVLVVLVRAVQLGELVVQEVEVEMVA
jgi:hypothetical protein